MGCGLHSEADHATSLKRYAVEHPGEISLVAACDLDPARAEAVREKFGFDRAYTKAREMLEREKPDGCICVMPMAKVVEVGVELLQRRIPCVIEKPPGISREQARHLATVARKTGTPHMISVNRRFNPLLNRAIAWAHEKGPLRFLHGVMARTRRPEEDFAWSTGIHAVDAFRHIAGEIRKHPAHVMSGPESPVKWFSLTLEFASGVHGQLDILPTAGRGQETYELIGEEFIARVSMPFWTETSLRCWHRGDLVVEEVVPADQPPVVTYGAYAETVHFIQSLQRGVCPHPTIADVLPSAEICFDITGPQHKAKAPRKRRAA
jgi:predicted dehydrogenase